MLAICEQLNYHLNEAPGHANTVRSFCGPTARLSILHGFGTGKRPFWRIWGKMK